LDRQKLYLETLGLTLSTSLLILVAFNVESLEIYLIIYTVAYLTLTALFRPRKKWLDITEIALFTAFCYIIAIKVLNILISNI
jgi:hypothetical protein